MTHPVDDNNHKEQPQPTKKEERKKPVETFDSIIDGFTQDQELRDALRGFLQYRMATAHRQKKAFTNQALKLNLTKLSKLSKDSREMTEIVNTTVMNGWSGFWKPDGKRNQNHKPEQRKLDFSDYGKKTGTYVVRDGKRYVYVDEERLEEVPDDADGEVMWYDGI